MELCEKYFILRVFLVSQCTFDKKTAIIYTNSNLRCTIRKINFLNDKIKDSISAVYLSLVVVFVDYYKLLFLANHYQ